MDSLNSFTSNFCHLGTLNCRGLSSENRLLELEEELSSINWDIIGLSEVKRKDESQIQLKSGNLFYFKGSDGFSHRGVGFLVNKNILNNVTDISGVSDRLAKLTLKINERYNLDIIQVYFPTSSHSDDEIEEFYQDLQELLDSSKSHYKMVIGDFNARVGKHLTGDTMVGKFGFGDRNPRGDRLVEFAEKNRMFISNTFFKKRGGRKWTWKHPNGSKSEIDFILTNRIQIIQDTTVLNRFKFYSDHRLVRSRINFNTKFERFKLVRSNLVGNDLDSLFDHKVKYALELSNRFSQLNKDSEDQNIDHCSVSINEKNTRIQQTILSAVKAVVTTKSKKVSKLSKETKDLMKKKREFIISNPIEEAKFRELNKLVRKKVTDDVRKYNTNLIKVTIENNKSMKKAKRTVSVGNHIISSIKRQDGSITSNKVEIVEVFKDFFQELYSSDRINQVNMITPQEEVAIVTVAEVLRAIKFMKKGKCPGEDNITIEMIKLGGLDLIRELAELFTQCLHSNKIPEAWNNANIILIFKKGDKREVKNYRPISLLSVLYKIFTKIILMRIQNKLEEGEGKEQAGFRSGYSTMDHIQVLNEIIARSNEYTRPLYVAFIDFEKAFDSISTESVLTALENQGVGKSYIETLRFIYYNATSSIKLHSTSDKFRIEKGVRQGDSISPKLFSAVLQEIFKTLKWNEVGIKTNGGFLSHLRFADDIVLFASSAQELQTRIEELCEASLKVGLKMNLSKTKVMSNKYVSKETININQVSLEHVDSYVYLGQLINTDDTMFEEVKRRTKLAWSAFGRLNYVFKGKLPICLKRKVFNQCVLPVLTYGCETWSLNVRSIQKLRVAQRGMERCMLGITRRDRKRNEWVREQTKVRDVIDVVMRLKWKWAGHIARRTDGRWTRSILDWIPEDGYRPKGRPFGRWGDVISKFSGAKWILKAQNRTHWKSEEETFVQQWTANGCI